VEVADGAALKKAGATTISVFFESPTDSSFTKMAWLLGTKAGKIIWKKPLPVKLEINTAKTDVVCRKGLIVLLSQYPGSAQYTSQSFSWDGTKALLVSTKSGDPSQEAVDALLRFAEKGSRAQLDAWNEQDHAVMYPGNYVTTDTLLKLLNSGHRAALALDKAGKDAAAVERMEICFDASQTLVELSCGGVDQTKTPSKWIAAWTADGIQLPVDKWAPLLKDYAQFLQKCGKHKQSQNILADISKQVTRGSTNKSEQATDAKGTSQN